MRKLTTREFIEKSNKVHENKYNYSKTKYVNADTKLIIVCKKHGEFFQKANHHVRGHGCPMCSGNKKLTKQDFIQQAVLIHNNRYDYSKVKYINAKTKVIIICKKHGEFLQSPNKHICSKRGCSYCAGNKKLTIQEFIKRAEKIHKNKYDYSLTIYKNVWKKVKIVCQKHGDFIQSPIVHLNGSGCNKCGVENSILLQKKDISQFIKESVKIHGNKYDYSKVKYINARTKIIIICKKHGEFKQTPNMHTAKKVGCPKCAKNRKLTTEQFVGKANNIHNNRYDYSKVKYINAKTKVIIICEKHGEFLQIPNNHLNNNGCPECINRTSKSSIKWLDNIEKKNNIKLEREFPLNINGKQFFIDGFDLKTNTCYEYNGIFWHGHPNYYNQDEINPRTKTTFGELYQKTLSKETLIKSAGFNIITKWGK